MNELPDFWRSEIWHPLTVHFPLALLFFATLFVLLGLLLRKSFMTNMGYVLVVLGTIGAWVAVYTGNLADGIVSRQICDPTVLKSHQNNALVVTWLFSTASIIAVLDYVGMLKKFARTCRILTLLIMLTGAGFLTVTGHHGAKLVYQQAAGVYSPSEDCSEFNE